MHENFNIFPFDKVEKGSKIILYGARTIGTEYLRQLQLLHYCEILFVIDRDYSSIPNILGVEVKNPQAVNDFDYDYIVVAVQTIFLESVLENLKLLNIPKGKIICSEIPKDNANGIFNLAQPSYSQYGDDLFILNTFKTLGINKPSYIDVGCHHPYLMSNTAILYSHGCRGINIDANPELIDNFIKERPEDINLNVGVSGKAGTLKFHILNSPGKSSFSMNQVEHYIKNMPEIEITKTIDVPAMPLMEIVNEYLDGKWPDFLDVDAEGLDFDILNNCDFSDDGPSLICVECYGEDVKKMNTMMTGRGYDVYCRLVANQFYLRNGLRERVLHLG